jgi:hypothetical protein
MSEISSGAYHGEPPYVAQSDTSREAAYSVAPTAASMRASVLRLFVHRGQHGATDDEIERSLGMLHQTASARRRELQLGGYIERTERRRLTSSGRSAGVYVATGMGQTWAIANKHADTIGT